MADSHREKILKQIVASLVAANIAGVQIARSRTTPVPRAEGPTFHVTWTDDLPIDISASSAPVDWDLAVELRLAVRGDIPDSVADPFVVAAHTALSTNATLAGLMMELTPGRVYPEFLDADGGACIVVMPYTIRYRITSFSDLTS